MSKQTRLSFGQASSAPAKRRRLNTNEKATTDDGEDKQSSTALKNPKSQPQPTSTKESSESDRKSKGKAPLISPSDADATDQTTPTEKSADKDDNTSESPSNTNANGSSSTEPSRPTNKNQQSSSKPPTHLTLTTHTADLFAAPPHTLLCHATNAQGTWGAGIALAFKKSYPAAFKLYAARCSAWNSSSLLGTTYLIPPQTKSTSKTEREANHWIGCLFTSERKGKGKGSKESIIEATGDAVEDLVRKVRDVNDAASVAELKGGSSKDSAIASVRMCKINSGLFGVPWEATAGVVQAVEVGEGDVEVIEVFDKA